jgi:hypothetical protein
MAVATAGAPARRERVGDAAYERPQQRTPIQLDERPDALAPTRGIALAVVLGLGAWALAIAAFLTL